MNTEPQLVEVNNWFNECFTYIKNSTVVDLMISLEDPEISNTEIDKYFRYLRSTVSHHRKNIRNNPRPRKDDGSLMTFDEYNQLKNITI